MKEKFWHDYYRAQEVAADLLEVVINAATEVTKKSKPIPPKQQPRDKEAK